MIEWFSSQRNRAYIYAVLLAATPVVAGYGLVSDEQWAAWLGLVAAVLGLGLAKANTSTKKESND